MIAGLIAAAALIGARSASADTGVGIDLQLGNKLDPTGGAALFECDERGRSWLSDIEHRTPTGYLYPCPDLPPVATASGAWQYHGAIDLGYVHQSGDKNNYLYQRFTDWRNGLVLSNLALDFERPDDGSYVDFRGSSLSDTDQYFKVTVGRYGRYRLEAFFRDLPNVLSNNAKPIWNGVGTNNLTLPSTLTPGASTPAQVSVVSAATPEQKLQVNREKGGVALNYFFTRQWTGYFSFSDEKRQGTRPFGGPFFFNYPFSNDGGVLETVKPIDDHTININGGLRYAGSTWRFDFGYSGSFYRDHYRQFDYQSPFSLYPVIPGAVSSPVYQGQFSMEPDNDYHQVRAGATRTLPMNGETSLSVSRAIMYQNEKLLAPINCQGQFGINLSPLGSPVNPYLYNCSDWNTTAALSRQRADLRINTTSVDATVRLQPIPKLALRGSLKFYEQDYANGYLSYNPLTGQYGYVNENGSQGSVVPGEAGIYNPKVDPTYVTQIRSLPLDTRTREATMGADWRPTLRNTLSATYTFNRYEPAHRERTVVDDSSIKLTWLNRSLDWLTLRANYTYLRQTGDQYNYNPYNFTFSNSLPGFVAPSAGIPAYTVDAERKYDLSDRTENKMDLMATYVVRDDMNLSTTLRGDWNQYGAVIGRQSYSTLAAMVQWEWQLSPRTNLSVFYSYDRSTLHLANVNDPAESGAGSDPRLGGSTYPYSAQWWSSDKESNHTVGITLRQQVRRARVDASWNYGYSRGLTGYSYASPTALGYFADAGLAGTAFPANFQRTNSFDLSVLIPVNERLSVRVFDYFETSKIADWHYAGFAQTLVYDHKVYTDGGPTNYSANIVGLFVTMKL
jgi:MtrB/PioB family decaheme-associated outer membrane protein